MGWLDVDVGLVVGGVMRLGIWVCKEGETKGKYVGKCYVGPEERKGSNEDNELLESLWDPVAGGRVVVFREVHSKVMGANHHSQNHKCEVDEYKCWQKKNRTHKK